MKKILILVLVNVVVVLLLLFLIEGAVRLFSANIVTQGTDENILLENRYGTSPGLKPLSSGFVFDHEVKINDKGFLFHPCTSSKKRKKVLFFGDSVTMGVGVDSDSSFAARLQNRFCDSLAIDNISLIGYNINDYVRIAEKLNEENRLKEYDEVVVFFCLNDNYLSTAVHSSVNQESSFTTVMEWLKGKSYTYVAIKGMVTDRSKAHYDFDKSLYENDTLISNLKDKISKLKSMIGENKLSFVLLPYEYQLRNNYSKENMPQQKLISILKSENILSTDMGLLLEKEFKNDQELYLYADGIHFSNTGHRVLSTYLTNNVIFAQNP